MKLDAICAFITDVFIPLILVLLILAAAAAICLSVFFLFAYVIKIFRPLNCFIPIVQIKRSLDGGSTYNDNHTPVKLGTDVYIKYEVSIKPKKFISHISDIKRIIPFQLEIPESEKLSITVHEYSGDPNPRPMNGLNVSKSTRFYVLADKKLPIVTKIVLKCHCDKYDDAITDTLHLFKISFDDNSLNMIFSKTYSLEFKRLRG